MTFPQLYIGNKNYSSWSMRPWLALKWAGIDFVEEMRRLGEDPGYGQGRSANILPISPSGRVPALHVDGLVIHDSLAICEWAHEQTGDLWPSDSKARAVARSVSAEMHSGFAALRRDLAMNLKRAMPAPPPLADDVQRDLERLFALWADARDRFGQAGPFLFGERCIADAMYAPVAARLRTYAIAAPPPAAEYCAAIFADAAFQRWEQAGKAEPWSLAKFDGLHT